MASEPIPLQSRIAYPREATPGATYLVSVDLDHAVPPEHWPYDDEEYPVTCLLDAAPYFEHESEGDATIVVHRYGGSYGPARFWLTAQAPPELFGKTRAYPPQIRIILVNGAGVPIHSHVLSDIEIVTRDPDRKFVPVAPPDAPTNVSAWLSPGPDTIEKASTFRWLHLADLQFSERRPGPGIWRQLAYHQLCRAVGGIDAIIVSGDITLSGQPQEFERAEVFFRSLRENIYTEQSVMPHLIVVPGNHDRTKLAGAQLPDSSGWGMKSYRRNEFWLQPAAHEGIQQSFANFSQWSHEPPGAYVRGLLPGDFATTLQVDGMQVGVVGLNDSIIDARSGLRADVHEDQLRAVCGPLADWASRHELRILITHHGPESLLPELRRNFYRDFAPRSLFDLHLYGSTKMVSSGIQTARGRQAKPASINAARFHSSMDRGLIGEASVRRGDVTVRVQRFSAELNNPQLKDEQRLSLGQRPVHPTPAFRPTEPVEPSIVTRPLIASGPAGQRFAIISGVDSGAEVRAKKSIDNLIQAFLDAGYENAAYLSPGLSREQLLSELHMRLVDRESIDLTVFVYSVTAGNLPLTRADVFDVARRAQRRLLVIGNLPGSEDVAEGCGIIGDLFAPLDHVFPAMIDALRYAAAQPRTVKLFASAFGGFVNGYGYSGAPQWIQLSEEIAELQMAAPKSSRRRKRSEPSGFDSEFMQGFPIPLPRVDDPGALLGPLLHHDHFSLLPNPKRRMAWFAAVNVDLRQRARSDEELDWEQWRYEPRLPRDQQLVDSLFKGSPFERSRLVKKMQAAWGTPEQIRRAFAATGTFPNVIPLAASVNRNPLWSALPDYVAQHQARDSRLSMLTGPLFATDDPLYRGIRVPAGCWRVLAFVSNEGQRVAAAFLTYQVDHVGLTFPRPLPSAPLVTCLSIEELSTLARLDFGDLTHFGVAPPGVSMVDPGIPGMPVTDIETAFPSR